MLPDVPVTLTVYAPVVVVSVVEMVTTSVPDAAGTELDARPQVAGLVAPLGPVTEQVRSTVEVNEPMGATVMVDLAARGAG